jgi:Xaa-Pro aminopeptidase
MLIENLINVRYLSDFTGTTAFIIVTPKKNFFFTDFRYRGYIEKHLPPHFDFVDSATLRKDGLKKFLKKHSIKSLGFESGYLNVAQYTAWKKRLKINLKPFSNVDSVLRISKTNEEITAIAIAQQFAEDALKKIIKKLKPGKTEREISDEIEIAAFNYCRENETRISFKPIVGFGANSSVPHHQNTNKKFKKGDIVLIDMGFMHAGYCSDMTRTFFTKTPSDFEAKIYDIVLKAQTEAIKHMHIGNTGGHCDKIARDIIAGEGYKDHFGHSLGHGIGLEVHEAPNIGPHSKDILVENCVVTSEPGIYLSGKFGVRIEDMIHVTKKGPVNLTKYPKKLEEVMMRK